MRDYNTPELVNIEVSALTAYRYLSGHYVSFEDVHGRPGKRAFTKDGMRVFSARYTVLDQERVMKKLQSLEAVGTS